MKTITKLLNIEEKKKLEKIIFEDIDRAKNLLDQKHDKQQNEILKQLVETKEAKQLLADYKANAKESKRISKEMSDMGITTGLTGTYNDNDRETIIIVCNYGSSNGEKLTKAIDDKYDRTREKLEGMKRTYTLKLFAGGVEAQEVMDSLMKELEALTK